MRNGDALVLDVEAPGAVTIRKSKRAPTLKDLVLRITPENRHSETDWGGPAGKELW